MRSNPPSSGCWLSLVACLAVGALAACSHPSTGGGKQQDAGCVAGTELCMCAAGSCDPGLTCSSGACVRAGSPGSGGASGGQGGGSGSGDGGSTGSGSGGGTGSGGSIGSGGTGGSTGSGSGGSSGSGTGGSPGTNMVTNGDFSAGEMFWQVIPNGGSAPGHSTGNGQLCVNLQANQSVTLGWAADAGSPLRLATGLNYHFTYRASASSQLVTFTAKVGHAVPNYDTDFQTDVTPGNSLTMFSHDFTVSAPDDNTGIAFIVVAGGSNSDVCVDDVSLTAN